MSDPMSLETLVTVVQQMTTSFDENTDALHQIELQLPDLVTKDEVREREQWVRRLIFKGVAGVAVLLALWAAYSVIDAREATRQREEREAAATAQAEYERDNLVRGCERANDQRATLREVITLAIGSPTVIPPGLDADIEQIIRDGQARAAELKVRLLALPGVQPVDCQSAFPPVTGTDERS